MQQLSQGDLRRCSPLSMAMLWWCMAWLQNGSLLDFGGGSCSLTEMTVMMPRAPKVPINTKGFDCFSESRSAMKKVLSPSSEKKINRNPDTMPCWNSPSPWTASTVACQHEREGTSCLEEESTA